MRIDLDIQRMNERAEDLSDDERDEQEQAEHEALQPDADEIGAFLDGLRPEGPYALGSFGDEKPRSRVIEEYGQAISWAVERNAILNVYVQSQTLNGVPKKGRAAKEDIAALPWMYADLDAEKGEDIEEAKARFLRRLTTDRPDGVPPPNCIVDSGGGLQAYWRLDEPFVLPLGGQDREAAIAQFEGRIRGLNVALGGDVKVADLSRILRLPGTVNRLDAAKRAAGRVPAMSRIVQDFTDGVHALDSFPFVAKGSTGNSPGGERERDTSRSGVMWEDMRKKIREGMSDEALIAILLDRNGPHNGHVYKVPRDYRKFAEREVSRARESVEQENVRPLDPNSKVVALLNETYCATSVGSNEVVASWQPSEIEGEFNLVLRRHSAFVERYRSKSVKVPIGDGKSRSVTWGEYWLNSPLRQSCPNGLRLDPSKPEKFDGYMNLWRGWGVEPKEGDCSLTLAHVREVLADGNETHATYILNWMAWGMQNPAEPAEVALGLLGKSGAGKGTIAEPYCSFFGNQGLQVYTPKHIFGGFNAPLANKCMIFFDEAIPGRDQASIGKLKGMMSEKTLMVESKGIDAIKVKNRLKFILASDKNFVMDVDGQARRSALFEVSDKRVGDLEYFKALRFELNNGGREAFAHFLLNRPLGDWHPRQSIPKTTALANQRQLSLRGIDAVMYEFLSSAQMLKIDVPRKDKPPAKFVSTRAFWKLVEKRWIEVSKTRRQDDATLVTETAVGRLLAELGFVKDDRRHNGRPRGFWVPPLADVRAKWDEVKGDCGPWDDAADWSEVEM
jgi:hypothetical protein